MSKLLNNLLGMYKQAKLNKQAEDDDGYYTVWLWPGAGYTLNGFATQANGEEAALYQVAQYLGDNGLHGYYQTTDEHFDFYKEQYPELSDEEISEKEFTDESATYIDTSEGFIGWVTTENMNIEKGINEKFIDQITIIDGPRKKANKNIKLHKKAQENLIEVGWGFGNNGEDMIKGTAQDLEKETDDKFWKNINEDIENAENDFLKDGYKKFFTKVRDEGHGSDNDLGGTAWVTKQQLEDFINKAQKADDGIYGLFESAGTLDIDTYHDDALVFHLYVYVDEETLDSLNIESKKINKNKNKKQSIKNTRVTKKADEDLNKEYKLVENGLPTFKFNKKIIDFLDSINKKFDKFCVKIYGKIVCFNEIKDKKLITDKGEEFDYRDFGPGLLLKIYNKLNNSKESSKAKLVRKQAENKEIVVTYEGTNGKEYIVKAPNGLYFNEYVDTDTQHSRGAGPFETLEKAKEMFKKHRPSAKEVVATKKQATIKHENGVYNVYSESGKCLGKGYKTKEEAEKRLKQVEYFKNKKSSLSRKAYLQISKEMIEDALNVLQSKLSLYNKKYNTDEEIGKTEIEQKNKEYNFTKKWNYEYGNFINRHNDVFNKLYKNQISIEQAVEKINALEKQISNKRTSLKDIIISKMAKSKNK